MAVLEQTTARTPARPTPTPAKSRRPNPRAILYWSTPTVVAALLAAAYVVLSPSSVDLAAHLFRAQMFTEHGFQIWNNFWYSGNEVLGYSVLFPPVSAALTPQLAAALATTGTATLFTPMARRHFGERAWVGAVLFGAATAADLYSGRLAFAFGALPAMAAIAALDDDRPGLACLLAVVSALCSPVAALFAALVAAGHAIGGVIIARRDRVPGHTPLERARPAIRAATPGAAVIVASLAPVLVLSWMFPQGGTEPFAFSTMLPLLVISAVALVMLPRDLARLRAGIAVYAVATLVVFLIPSPIGSNIARLGTFAALPLVALVWWGRRPRALALVFLPLLYVAVSPAVRDSVAGDVDYTASTSYYAPLLHFLHGQAVAPGTAPFRTEIPFTQFHWEAYEVATRFSLARGWERQLDIRYNRLFYDGRLTVVPVPAVAARRRGPVRGDLRRHPGLLRPGRDAADRLRAPLPASRVQIAPLARLPGSPRHPDRAGAGDPAAPGRRQPHDARPATGDVHGPDAFHALLEARARVGLRRARRSVDEDHGHRRR